MNYSTHHPIKPTTRRISHSHWGLILLLLSSLSKGIQSLTPSLDIPFQSSFHKLPQTPCVSLFTRNGRIGCSTSSREENVGILIHWNTLFNANAYYDDGNNNNNQQQQQLKFPPFVAVLDDYEFTSDTVDQIVTMDSNNALKGILIVNSTDTTNSNNNYSPAPKSPQGEDSPSNQLTPDDDNDYEWNTNGDGLLYRNMYGIPAGYISDADLSDYLITTSKDQAGQLSSIYDNDKYYDGSMFYPAIVAKYNLYMGPQDITTKDCLSWIDYDGVSRPKCLPLGGNSVWAVAGSPTYTFNNNDNNDDGNQNGNNERRRRDEDSNQKPIIMVATSMDSTSMFHDKSPGANTAASNILTLLMSAKLLGTYVNDSTLDSFQKQIMFNFFNGESYGFMGSRSFLRDVAYPGFQCDDGRTVPSNSKKNKDGTTITNQMACLNPLRHDLDFMNLGDIAGMIAIDQIGVLSTENTFYVQSSGNGFSEYLSDVFVDLTTDDWSIEESSSGAVPPTPLSSLIQLSEGGIGGVVLTGYDDSFADDAHYLSHLDSNSIRPINLEAIATAATAVARAAVAAAYDDDGDDSANAVAYAQNLIPDMYSNDESLLELADCLLTNGSCDLLLKYGKVERINQRDDTGYDLGMGVPLGKPPNYYVSVFDASNGQAFVQVDGIRYGAYTGETDYGKSEDDAFFVRPSLLEMSIHGLLNDYLGRGSTVDSDGGDGVTLQSCESSSDCSSISYCSSSGDSGVCTGGKQCVCSRSHYHVALDEAIVPVPNNRTGVFMVSEDDEGISPMFTEPYWSRDIGISVYRDSGGKTGAWALGLGFIFAGLWVALTLFMKRHLKKEKLY